jgi:hypothetical protein
MKEEIKFYTIKHKNTPDKTTVVSVEDWLKLSTRSQGYKIVARHATDPRGKKDELPVARPMLKPKEDAPKEA